MVGCSADSCEGANAAAVAVAAMRSILIVACALSRRAVAFAPPRSALSPRAFAPRSSVRPLRRSAHGVAMAAREHRTAAVVGGGPAGLLSAIALAAYGDASLWPRIQEANADKIKDPAKLEVGMELIIP